MSDRVVQVGSGQDLRVSNAVALQTRPQCDVRPVGFLAYLTSVLWRARPSTTSMVRRADISPALRRWPATDPSVFDPSSIVR